MVAEKPSTMTDPRSQRCWRIRDAIIRLREHATDRAYGLPAPAVACALGTASELRIDDSTGTVSRAHAQLVPAEVDGELVWKIHDLRSKNGLRCDGEPVRGFIVRPGIEIGLGSLRLIAESTQLLGLLAVLRRFLGWAVEKRDDVDQALRTLRDWAAQRADLIVVGDGDLMPVVRRLHNLVIGADVSFTWYAPEQHANDAAAAVKASTTGTLCVDAHRQADALALIERVRETEYIRRPQLVLCTAEPASAATLKGCLDRAATIHVPSLASRKNEVEAILQECATEVAQEQRLPGSGLTMRDLEALSAWPFRSIAEIEDTALRLMTLRTWGLTPGAAKLGIDHSTLRSWAQRRGLET